MYIKQKLEQFFSLHPLDYIYISKDRKLFFTKYSRILYIQIYTDKLHNYVRQCKGCFFTYYINTAETVVMLINTIIYFEMANGYKFRIVYNNK